ncbi:MAG: hypothetical protein ACXWPM_09665 [Bdellovibrionota bacterium]
MMTTKENALKTIGLLGLLAMALAPRASFAAKFANQFTEFELPPQWQCNLEGAEWVCQNTNDAKKRDAIIVLAAKLKGDQDSLDQYLTYLKSNKTYNSVQGKPVKSEMKYAKTVNINGQAWVDALHMESEIPGFYTRYLATVKQDIGVLVTYSINKGKYQQYLDDFDAMVKTLKVFRKAGAINTGPQGNIFNNVAIPQGAVSNDTVFSPTQIAGGSDNKAAPKQDIPMLYILLGVGVVGFIIWRRKKSQSG